MGHFAEQRKSNVEVGGRSKKKREKDRKRNVRRERGFVFEGKGRKETRERIGWGGRRRRGGGQGGTRRYSLDDLCGTDAISKTSLESSPSPGTALLVNHRDPPTHWYRLTRHGAGASASRCDMTINEVKREDEVCSRATRRAALPYQSFPRQFEFISNRWEVSS